MNRRSALITLGGMGALGILGLSSKAHAAAPTPVKLVVVGSSQVGKSCLLIRYTTNAFPGEYIPKVYDNYSANMTVDGTSCLVGLWDVGSTEQYDRVRPLTYPQTDVFLALFSIVDPQSFDEVKTKWLPEVKHHVPTAPLILVGTKSEVRDDRATRQTLASKGKAPISKERAEELRKEIGAIAYVETSAKAGIGLTTAFETGVRAALAGMAKTKVPTPLPKPSAAPTVPPRIVR